VRRCTTAGRSTGSLALTVRSIVAVGFAIVFSGSVGAQIREPTFEQYPAVVSSITVPAKVRLESHPKARTYRTVLRGGAKEGPNFAGHYTIVTWGCGTACQEVGIVDAKNGEVFFPRQLQPNAYQAVTDETPPFQYRLDSKLLVVAGSPLDRDDNIGIHYFLWTGRNLKQLLYVPKVWP
jgi:hypothetical protein